MKMHKITTALLLALLLGASASAEVYVGVTAALDTVSVVSEVSGTLASTDVLVGQRVAEGEALLTLSPTRAFAAWDGTVSLAEADPGEDVDGAVLRIAPVWRYTIHCSVTQAYQSAESTLVHAGETLYARCTQDGSHRAVGTVCNIEGSDYQVLTTGGELYLGEVVYLYRSTDFTAAQRVGIGTVVATDPVASEGSGTLTRLCVDAGDPVERGQLLYELDGGTVASPVSGIVASCGVQPGQSVVKDQVVACVVPDGQVGIEVTLDETAAARVQPGDTVELAFAWDIEGDTVSGTVIDCAWTAVDGAYVARIQPETDALLPLGMGVSVWI